MNTARAQIRIPSISTAAPQRRHSRRMMLAVLLHGSLANAGWAAAQPPTQSTHELSSQMAATPQAHVAKKGLVAAKAEQPLPIKRNETTRSATNAGDGILGQSRTAAAAGERVGDGGPRQGGETCETATPITSLPFTATGTTIGYVDDYDEVCPHAGSTSTDVVYSYVPSRAMALDITLCEDVTNYDSKIYVYEDNCVPGTAFACNDDACSSPYFADYASVLPGVAVQPGHTYFIVVDGWDGWSGDYQLDVTEGVPLGCPASSLFAQPVHAPNEAWQAAVSDSQMDYRIFEDFENVTGEICEIHWWGLDLLCCWSECTSALEFTIAFYPDVTGQPDLANPTCEAFGVVPTRIPTGVLYTGFELNFYAATIPCCTIASGWIEVTATDGDDCLFLWMSSAGGNTFCWRMEQGVFVGQEYDRSLCLVGESTPIPGACCYPDGTCEIVVQSACVGGEWLGPGTTCNMCPCVVPCVPNEGEPVCHDNYEDQYNGGCNSTPPVFQPIACGDTVCGTSGVYDYYGTPHRDTDWFELELTQAATITWEAEAEFEVLVYVMYAGSGDCLDYVTLGEQTAPECEVASLTFSVLPGAYWLWVGPADWDPAYECGVKYEATLTCGPPCTVECDPGATLENEPNCGIPVDTVNGGCGGGGPVVFGSQLAQCGDMVCGTAAWNGSMRDNDWYEFDHPGGDLGWTVEAEFTADLLIVVPGEPDPCGDSVIAESDTTTPCVPLTLTYADAPARTYWLVVAPSVDQPPFACGLTYQGTVDCEPQDCDDGDPCTFDFLDPVSGLCEHVPDAACQEPYCDGIDCGPTGGGTANSAQVQLFSGEFVEQVTDLQIPGRGFDFVLIRTYRSHTGQLTVMGQNWDMSYNLYLRDIGSELLFYNGVGRVERFEDQGDGTWGRLEYFRLIEEAGAGQYTMTHADRTIWTFATVPGAPSNIYKIVAMEDRNGNEMTFEYDAEGRLWRIRDTLDVPGVNDHTITLAYDLDGLLESVSDWTGREIHYEHYQDGEPGGSAGDLASVTYPDVVATPDYPIPPGLGHEYPDGKTWTYTYTTGFTDEHLNHDLLTITDGRRNDPNDPTYGNGPYLTNIYAHTISPGDPRYTEDPADPNFDRAVAQIYGDGRYDFVFTPDLNPGNPQNNGAVAKTVVNNRNGDVKELFFDYRNRLAIRHEYTGRAADPSALTDLDAGINPPVNPLRPYHDPPLFAIWHEWNEDSLVTRTIPPNGNIVEYEYDSANPNRRARGCRTVVRRLPGTHTPVGNQPLIEESYEYEMDFFGCCSLEFATRYTNPRGHDTQFQYDASGNLTRILHPIAGILDDFEYNAHGQITARTWPDNGSGHRRRDEYTYYESSVGDQYGQLKERIVDAGGFDLMTTYHYNSVGQVAAVFDPRGHDTQCIVNQLNQVVREISREVDGAGTRYEGDYFFDANDNLVRVDIENRDDEGTLGDNTHFTAIYAYDLLDNRVRTCKEVGDFDVPVGHFTCEGLPAGEFITTEYEYDANDNLALLRDGEAANGNQPNNIARNYYDERDLLYRKILAEEHPDHSTTQYDYDGNGNVVRLSLGIEDPTAPRVWTHVFDSYNRTVTLNDPMDNVTTYEYDASSNSTRELTEGELIDVPGAGNNIRLYEKECEYDAVNRVVLENVAFFETEPPQPNILDGWSTTTTEWSANSQITRIVNDNNHQTLNAYDSANRLSVVTDAKGNTIGYVYDENSNVITVTETEQPDLGGPAEVFHTNYTYDGLDRRIQSVDNVGNTHQFFYDSRDNKTRGIDALEHETGYEYDGINRLIQTVHDMNGNGADPSDPDDVLTSKTWDDSSRLITQTDDNGHTTTHEYDPLNRKIRTIYADETAYAYEYDWHHNRTRIEDASGTVTTQTYDRLDRLDGKVIEPAEGVWPHQTTSETYRYDGLSRLVHAENISALVTRAYDSLSNLSGETLNGQTISSTYDGVGNRLQCTYPGSEARAITYTYDYVERIHEISDAGTGVVIAAYDYVGPGRVARCVLGNETRTEYTYDGISGIPNPPDDFGVKRIVRKRHVANDETVIDNHTFAWDRMYNKVRRQDVRAGGPQLMHEYEYDALYRLLHTHVTDGYGEVIRDEVYELDGAGMRTRVTGGEHPGVYSCNPDDCPVNQYTMTPVDGRDYTDNGFPGGIRARLCGGDSNCDNVINSFDIDAFVLALMDPTMWEQAFGIFGCDYVEENDCNCDGTVNAFDIDAFVMILVQAQGPIKGEKTPDPGDRVVEHDDYVAGERHTYAYDALGRRIVRIVDADGPARSETHFFYDGWRVCAEQDEGGETQATYVCGNYIDEVLTMRRDADGNGTPEDYYYHSDDLYSVVAVSDDAGTVVERYQYQDYGEPSFFDGGGAPLPQSAIDNPYLFTGRRYDPESGWYYCRSRYLDPVAGRYATRDPLGVWGDRRGLGNGVTYVADNPATLLDPLGLDEVSEPVTRVSDLPPPQMETRISALSNQKSGAVLTPEQAALVNKYTWEYLQDVRVLQREAELDIGKWEVVFLENKADELWRMFVRETATTIASAGVMGMVKSLSALRAARLASGVKTSKLRVAWASGRATRAYAIMDLKSAQTALNRGKVVGKIVEFTAELGTGLLGVGITAYTEGDVGSSDVAQSIGITIRNKFIPLDKDTKDLLTSVLGQAVAFESILNDPEAKGQLELAVEKRIEYFSLLKARRTRQLERDLAEIGAGGSAPQP